jgi:pantothenate kinase
VLVTHVLEMERQANERLAIGIVGGPGTGKSTIAGDVVAMLNATQPGSASLIPMDGFHMRHSKLESLGLVDYKGAPHTFEGTSFVNFLTRLKTAEEPVKGPGYSRKIEDVVKDAFEVPSETQVLVVEGNYLLLADPPWVAVKPLLDFSAFIDVPREVVRERLMRRHAEEGLFSEERNRAHIERTDLPNYDLVSETQNRADLVISLVTDG